MMMTTVLVAGGGGDCGWRMMYAMRWKVEYFPHELPKKEEGSE